MDDEMAKMQANKTIVAEYFAKGNSFLLVSLKNVSYIRKK